VDDNVWELFQSTYGRRIKLSKQLNSINIIITRGRNLVFTLSYFRFLFFRKERKLGSNRLFIIY